MDEGFQTELEQIIKEPAKELNMETAPAEVRQRSAKLCGLLAGLVKNRALSIARAAPAGNGFEALRQLTLSMRPSTQARGLALLSSVTAWPAFQVSKSLQAQVLRLEETRRAGTVLGDELKCAIMLRCITGALKTHLSLNLKENCKYPELPEEVLKWDRAHQKWSNLLQSSDDTTGGTNNNDTVPMEIDRIEGRGRGKGGKGKSKTDKGNAKGKSKSKSKDKGKGKNSSYDGGGKSGKGKSVPTQGKKGGKGDKSCYVCGKSGHYARDGWQNQSVRNVQNVSHGGQGQPDQGQNSVQHSGQQPQTQQSPPNQPTQYRVSRISELNEHAEADQEQFVFDLRVSPPTSPKSNVSPLRALHFYIGDDGDEISNQHGDVRAVVTEMPGEGDM